MTKGIAIGNVGAILGGLLCVYMAAYGPVMAFIYRHSETTIGADGYPVPSLPVLLKWAYRSVDAAGKYFPKSEQFASSYVEFVGRFLPKEKESNGQYDKHRGSR
jgi:hypothetical protein